MLVSFVSLALLTTATASITCALPAGGTYKAGDSVILDWGSDGNSPVVSDIVSVNGSLYCNSGVMITEFPIPVLTGSYNWTLPSVGNATTVGGTVGTCPGNAFHMQYSGMANGFLNIMKIPWGPVQCGTITILPAPNGTVTTTTMTPTATATPINESGGGGLSTIVIVVIAVIIAVVVTLSFVALAVCLRRRRRQRKLDNVLMPWNTGINSNNASTTNHNRFSKVPSLEDDPGSPDIPRSRPISGGIGTSSAAAVGAETGAQVSFALKSQANRNKQYYGDEYGYQQEQLLQQQQQGYPSEYDGYNEEDVYYNPYYASGGIPAVVSQSDPSSFYSQTSAPYQSATDLYQQLQQQQQQQPGYFPPPPQGHLSTISLPTSTNLGFLRNPISAPAPTGRNSMPIGSVLASMPVNNSGSSSPKRGPQIVMSEMGRKEAEADSENTTTTTNEKVLVENEKVSNEKDIAPSKSEVDTGKA
ncbi:hypothetical protein FBU30_007666 [Linnemannia zychae]|nr:hypothetical protein FBU30_007666 [Linnemannia zychae]